MQVGTNGHPCRHLKVWIPFLVYEMLNSGKKQDKLLKSMILFIQSETMLNLMMADVYSIAKLLMHTLFPFFWLIEEIYWHNQQALNMHRSQIVCYIIDSQIMHDNPGIISRNSFS